MFTGPTLAMEGEDVRISSLHVSPYGVGGSVVQFTGSLFDYVAAVRTARGDSLDWQLKDGDLMGEELRLTLFGGMEATLGGRPLDLPYKKSLALLSYLVTSGRSHSRESLSTLLWGESNDDRARASLRTALWHLNEVLAPFLITDRHSVTFNSDAPHWIDAVEFGERIEGVLQKTCRGADTKDSPLLTEHQAAVLNDAVELYRGEFMAGWSVRNAPDFEDWLLRRREWSRELAVRALHRLVTYYKVTGDYRSGLDAVSQLLVVAPWQEEAHRERMMLLLLSGRRNAALAQYEACRHVLAEFLNTEPTLETELLFREIRAGRSPSVAQERSSGAHFRFPSWCSGVAAQEGTLVGRQSEAARLKRLLMAADTRLVSVVGPHGVGKTHLACDVAEAVSRQYDQAGWFIPLEREVCELESGGESWDSEGAWCTSEPDTECTLIMAIGRSLGLTFSTDTPLLTQLCDYLRHREQLLVLDGFKPAPAAVELVSAMLLHTSQLRILITAAEPLGIEGEQSLHLTGLNLPAQPAHRSATRAQLERLKTFDGIRLFVERAEKASPDFRLTLDNVTQVVRICRLTDGFPLTIELLAAWVGRLPLAAMADDIEWRLQEIRGRRGTADSPPAVRAVLSYVWDLLTSDQQTELLHLACFPAQFGADVAREVAGVKQRRLQTLCQRGFLSCSSAGRYGFHPLVRRFLLRKLRGTGSRRGMWEWVVDLDRLEDKMTAMYLALLERRGEPLAGRGAKTAAAEIRRDWYHIRRAWCRAASRRDRDRLGESLKALSRFLLLQGWYWEGARLFGAAANALLPQAGVPEKEGDVALVCRLLTEEARLLNAQMRYGEAAQVAESVVKLASDPPVPSMNGTAWRALQADAHIEWGKARYPAGELTSAKDHLERALDLTPGEGHQEVRASGLRHLGVVEIESERFDEARRHLEQALSLYEAAGDWSGRSKVLTTLSLTDVAQRLYVQAEDRATEALQIAGSMGDDAEMALAHTRLCRIDQARQDRLSAAVHCRQGRLAAHQIGEPRREGGALREWAWLLLEEGEEQRAWNYGLLALELARVSGHRGDEAQAWLLVGHILSELTMPEQARRACHEALRIQRALGQFDAATESLALLASLSLSEGHLDQAQELVEEILDYVNGSQLAGARNPISVYLTCYQVLSTAGDDRAEDVLETASHTFEGQLLGVT